MHQVVMVANSRPHLQSAASFLRQNCDVHRHDYQFLIAQALAQYTTSGISVTDLLTLQGWVAAQVVMLNNTLFTLGQARLNVAAHLVSLLQTISRQVHLPDIIIAGAVMDLPEDDVARHGGPWFGYCNIMSQTTSIMYPSGHYHHKTMKLMSPTVQVHHQRGRPLCSTTPARPAGFGLSCFLGGDHRSRMVLPLAFAFCTLHPSAVLSAR